MPKRSTGGAENLMKYIPIAVMAVSLISGYVLLGARVSTAEEKLKEQNAKIITQSSDTTGIQVSQALLETKLDNLVEYLKERRGK